MAPDYSISKPLESPLLRVISLGAGVQSSTLALMAARGEIGPMPDAAIFADTQWEPAEVYAWLAWLETQLPFPVYHVTNGNLRERVVSGKYSSIPAFVRGPDGKAGGMVNRSCTRDHKIVPIIRKVRELVGLTRKVAPKQPIVEQWIGISTDELQRLKDSREKFIHHRWPLIELRMSRSDCLRWMADRQYPTPQKSACIGCPFHSNAEWRQIQQDPAAWADAVAADRSLRSSATYRAMTKGEMFLHRSCVPLDEANLGTEAQKAGQVEFGFDGECEGMCGV